MSEQQTPGFVDAHSHLRATSLASQGVVNCQNLEDALLRFTAMTAVDPQDDAFVACSDLISGGVTGVQVMFHTFGGKSEYQELLHQVLLGIEKSSIRALVILGVTDTSEFLPKNSSAGYLLPGWVSPKTRISVSEMAAVLHWAQSNFPDLSFGIGPVGPQWCSDAMLAEVGELSQQVERIHTHLLESPRQRAWLGENPLLRLERHGLLGPKTSLAHGIWCSAEDLSRISASGARLVTCPGSNRALNTGSANLQLWRSAGVEFGFGLDSAAEEVLPLPIAATAMDSLTAVSTLTRGGQACTGLDTGSDRVVWKNIDLGQVSSVRVGNRELVADGKIWNQDEVFEARLRIIDRMEADEAKRQERISQLDQVMAPYQAELDRCLN